MRRSLCPSWLRQTSLLPRLPRAAPQNLVPRRIATTSAMKSAPVDIPRLNITPGSAHHNSLPSFLEYAKRTNLAPERTTYIGTHYEYTTALALMRLGFSLLRVGKRQDAGIDLIGHWVLAPLREPLPVIIQCKARKIAVSPCNVRELEGSFQGIPAGWKKKNVLGLLITTKKATKGVLEALGQSRWPMGFVLVSIEGTIQQFVWNRAASERGLEGVGVTVRHTPRALLPEFEDEGPSPGRTSKKSGKRLARFRNAGTKKDIQLTWMGSPIFPDRDNLDQETVKLMGVIAAGEDGSEGLASDGEKGRPEGTATMDKRSSIDLVPGKRGRPRSSRMLPSEKVPSPRGGQIPVRSAPVARRGPGRPEASKNKSMTELASAIVKKRGRPPGSKNKPKPSIDAG